MKLALHLVAFAVIVTSVRADWVIVEQTHTGEKKQKMTIQIKGSQTRTDMGDSMTVIIGEDGKAQMFNHKSKSLMVLDPDALRSAGSLISAFTGGNEAAKPKATGEKVKVGQWDTEIYTWESKVGKSKLYVAKDFPKYQEVSKAMDRAKKATSNPMAALFPDASEFPGMIVKSEMTTMGKTSVTELVSAREEILDASLFKGPEGYSEMKMPKLPGGMKLPEGLKLPK